MERMSLEFFLGEEGGGEEGGTFSPSLMNNFRWLIRACVRVCFWFWVGKIGKKMMDVMMKKEVSK